MDNIGALIVPAALALYAISIVARGIRIVQQAQTMIIERLGKYHRTLSSGVNLIIPIIDKPRAIDWHQVIVTPAGDSFARHFRTDKIDLRETVYVFPRQNVITKDNVVVEIDALIYSQITDPVRATYEIANLPDAIEKLTQTTLRNVIGEMELDHVLSSRDTINAKLREILDEATHKWGAKVSRVELKDINPPRDIRDAMEKQMRAERDRRAAILNAEAEKQSRILQAEGIRQSEINQAEGQKQAKILAAEAEANARLKVAEAEAQAIERITSAIKGTGGDPARYLIAIRYIEALKDMVTSPQSNKVIYLPYEATGVLASRGGSSGGGILALRDTTGDGKADVRQELGSDGGTGIALGRGVLYFSTASTVYRYAMRAGSLTPLGPPDVIVKDLPAGGHRARNLALSPDGGALYVNVGSPSNACQVADRSGASPGKDPCPELATRAGIWRFDPSKPSQTQAAGTRYATGIRNAVGLAFAPDGQLWATQHGRDQLGQNWPKLLTLEQSAEKPSDELLRLT